MGNAIPKGREGVRRDTATHDTWTPWIPRNKLERIQTPTPKRCQNSTIQKWQEARGAFGILGFFRFQGVLLWGRGGKGSGADEFTCSIMYFYFKWNKRP